MNERPPKNEWTLRKAEVGELARLAGHVVEVVEIVRRAPSYVVARVNVLGPIEGFMGYETTGVPCPVPVPMVNGEPLYGGGGLSLGRSERGPRLET